MREHYCFECVFCRDAASKVEKDWGVSRYECDYYFCDISQYRKACSNFEYNYSY